MYVPDDDNYIVDGENYAPPRPPQDDNKKSNPSQMIKIAVLVVIVIVLGLSVYFISSLFFKGDNKNETAVGISDTLSIDDPEVESIYDLVTYGRDNNTLNKYLKEQSVILKDFSNYEKFYYALSLLKEKELKEIKNSDTTTQKQYYISDADMDQLMKSYFGDKVEYLKQGTLPIILVPGFDVGNTLSLKYNINKERYETTLSKTDVATAGLIPVAFYGLESATRSDDGMITLVERVVYITSSVNNNLVSYQVYRDYNHTMLIDSQTNIALEEYQKEPLSIDDYMEKANIITYKFKENNGEYYFYQSKIEQ